mmetsp:Transcript_29256/g.71759  ORF Transcript_29256/g.71759 Transcript_29256/m.71759 type:complete len:258 (-) Transcript_29256:39-812(-)
MVDRVGGPAGLIMHGAFEHPAPVRWAQYPEPLPPRRPVAPPARQLRAGGGRLVGLLPQHAAGARRQGGKGLRAVAKVHKVVLRRRKVVILEEVCRRRRLSDQGVLVPALDDDRAVDRDNPVGEGIVEVRVEAELPMVVPPPRKHLVLPLPPHDVALAAAHQPVDFGVGGGKGSRQVAIHLVPEPELRVLVSPESIQHIPIWAELPRCAQLGRPALPVVVQLAVIPDRLRVTQKGIWHPAAHRVRHLEPVLSLCLPHQ